MGALILAIVVILSIFFQLWWQYTKSYWAKRNVPFIPPYPVLGNLTFIARQNTFLWFRSVYEKFRLPYLGMWFLWKPAILINSPELAQRILITDFDIFKNRYVGAGEHDVVGKLNLALIKDPQWSSIRKKMTPMFTIARLKNLQDLMTTKSKELVKRIEIENKNTKVIDLKDMFSDYATDIISIAAFGVKSEATLTGGGIMRQITNDFMKFDFHRGLAWGCLFFFPSLANVFKFTAFPKNTVERLKFVFDTALRKREESQGAFDNPKDLLDALLKMKHDSSIEEVSNDLLLAQAAIFLEAGFKTTGLILTHAAYELAHSSEIQERLYKEVYNAKQKIDGAELDTYTLTEMVYLNCVLKETLRKYPPLGWLDRVALKNYKVDEVLTIPEATPVVINVSGIHYDPSYFENPETFNPERFFPENITKSCTFLTFGDGPRNCIGQRFAYQSMCFALAEIILNYEIHSLPGSPPPSKRELETMGMFLIPKKHHSVLFVSRLISK